MRKAFPATGVVITGIAVIAVLLMNGLFSVAPAFEDLTDGFRDTIMTDEAITAAKADLDALSAVSTELTTTVIPTLSTQLGMDPGTFSTYLDTEYPAVAAGAGALPGIVEQFQGVVALIEAEKANFESADALPTSSIPATTLPWMILGIGVLALLIGGWMYFGGRAASWTAIVAGVAVVTMTLGLSMLGKSADADEMNDAFRPVYTAELVDGSAGALGVIDRMATEMQTGLIPGLAQALGMSEADVQAFIGSEFPATAAALQSLPSAMGRFEGMVGVFDAQLDNYQTIKDTALTPIAWTVLIAGALMILFGIMGAFGGAAGSASGSRDKAARELVETTG